MENVNNLMKLFNFLYRKFKPLNLKIELFSYRYIPTMPIPRLKFFNGNRRIRINSVIFIEKNKKEKNIDFNNLVLKELDIHNEIIQQNFDEDFMKNVSEIKVIINNNFNKKIKIKKFSNKFSSIED